MKHSFVFTANKIERTMCSCINMEQLYTAFKYCYLLVKRYKGEHESDLFTRLIFLLKQQSKRIKERNEIKMVS